MKTYLGIDYGSKRVGIALGDDDTKIARPLEILSNDGALMANLSDLIKQHQPAGLVLGLPRGLDGQETAQTKLTRDFGGSLGRFELSVKFQDEAVTSELAGSGSRTPADDRAAALILQDYLDGL